MGATMIKLHVCTAEPLPKNGQQLKPQGGGGLD